jgi:hypothetical protein
MPTETVKASMAWARTKSEFLSRSPLQYLVLAMLAGVYSWRFAAGTSEMGRSA